MTQEGQIPEEQRGTVLGRTPSHFDAINLAVEEAEQSIANILDTELPELEKRGLIAENQPATVAKKPLPAAEPSKEVVTKPVREAEIYPGRAKGESEAQFQSRIKGRDAAQVTLSDFLRGANYEYLAGGQRREALVSGGLGTVAKRKDFHQRQVRLARQTGKPVPAEVLADYPELQPVTSADDIVQRYAVHSKGKIPREIATKNAGLLLDAIQNNKWTDLLHPDNKISRKIYTDITGKKLPRGVSDTKAMFIHKEPPPQTSPIKPIPAQQLDTRVKK